MSKIIKSVRKELLNKEFAKKGLSTELTDIKVRLKNPLEEMYHGDVKRVLFDAMVKHVRQQIKQASSFEELHALAQKVSFGQYKVVLEQLDYNQETKEGLDDIGTLKLFESVLKLPAQREVDKLIEIMEGYIPIKVIRESLNFKDEFRSETGYTLGNGKITKRFFNKKWRLTNDRHGEYKYIFSLEQELAKALYSNSMEKFILDNQTLLKVRIIEEIVHRHQQDNIIKLPTDEALATAIKSIGAQYNLFPKGCKFEPLESLNKYKHMFFVPVTDEGYISRLNRIEFESLIPAEMIKQMEYLVNKTERRLSMESDYARVFQTKKHINKQTKSVMDNNEFLSKYGYVEIDNDVDLKLFRQLEKDFKVLCQKIHIPTTKDHSFRIKKLGRHRAAGLYFPDPIKSIIFDLDHPSAFIHELGHLIDHTLFSEDEKMVSETFQFRKVLDRYKRIMDNKISNLDMDNPFRIQWFGKSKYNRSYYFQPTEVFARSYELYIYHKGIRSSFLQESYTGEAYTHDEAFIELINDYFDDLLSSLPVDPPEKEENKSPIKVATVQPSNQELPIFVCEEGEEFGQLSLF